MLRAPQRRGFRVGLTVGLARVGMLENVQALSISRHQTVFDAVVDHLDEVACARGAAVKIAFFSRAGHLVASGRSIDVAASGRERFENRIKALRDFYFAADHL